MDAIVIHVFNSPHNSRHMIGMKRKNRTFFSSLKKGGATVVVVVVVFFSNKQNERHFMQIQMMAVP